MMAARYAIIGEYEGEGIALFVTDDRAEAHRVRENAIHLDRVVCEECETDPMTMALTTVCNETGVCERITEGCDSVSGRWRELGAMDINDPEPWAILKTTVTEPLGFTAEATSVLPRRTRCQSVPQEREGRRLPVDWHARFRASERRRLLACGPRDDLTCCGRGPNRVDSGSGGELAARRSGRHDSDRRGSADARALASA